MKTVPCKKRRLSGFTLIEVMLAIFLLAVSAVIIGVIYPSAQISRIKAVHMTFAMSMAQKKLEDARSSGYALVPVTPTVTTPFAELPNGTQSYTVTQYAPNIRKVEVTVTWNGYRMVGGRVSLVTFISDHS